MNFYKNMADVAGDILSKFKQGDIRLVVDTAGAPPANEWDPPSPPTRTEYILDATAELVDQRFARGTLVEQRGTVITVSPYMRPAAGGARVLTDVDVGSILSVDGDIRTVSAVKRIPDAGTVVCWKVWLED